MPPSMDARFPSTDWTLLEQGVSALGPIYERYRPPMLAYLHSAMKLPPEAADDIVQAFAADKLLGADLLRQVNCEKGKFRTLLVRSLHHYAISWLRKENAHRRRAGPAPPLDALPASPADPHQMVFALPWARLVLTQALESMKSECQTNGRDDIWCVFEQRLLGPLFEQRPAEDYEALARRLNLSTAQQARQLLTTAKRAFARHLRHVVAQYALDEADLEAELRDLLQILQSSAPNA